MTYDPTSEAIAHFIGILDLVTEENRLRDEYQSFKAAKAVAEDTERPDGDDPRTLKSDYKLKDFDPSARYELDETDVPPNGAAGPNADLPVPDPTNAAEAIESELPVPPELTFGPGPSMYFTTDHVFWNYVGSVITYTSQTATLFDNDILGAGAGQDVDALLENLVATSTLAYSLHVQTLDSFEAYLTPSLDQVVAFGEAITSVSANAPFATTVLFGDDVSGIYINGLQADEAPLWTELLPAAIAPADDGDDAPVNDARDAQSEPSPYAVVDGQNVMSGGNQMINEVALSTSWLDAPVIAVAGKVSDVTAISQVNLLVDRDTVPGFDHGPGSQVLNIADVAKTAFSLKDDDADGAESLALPSSWHLDRIEGDVLAVNAVFQYSFATDMDTVVFTFGDTAARLGTGENLTANSAQAVLSGYGYDLVIVGGDMITLDYVQQTNVLIDSDVVYATGTPVASMSTDDNLLVNHAAIHQQGIDTYEEMTDNFIAATEALADGTRELAQNVAQDALFAGQESLRALYIEGDLTRVSLVEQVNVLGDQDQIELAIDEFVAATTNAALQVTTGSNALVNAAQLTDYGVDSTILAAQEVYEDALLYQAELIDTNANPAGVNIEQLASEAVAFLAEDLVLPDIPEPELAIASLHDGSTPVDVMQTMIA